VSDGLDLWVRDRLAQSFDKSIGRDDPDRPTPELAHTRVHFLRDGKLVMPSGDDFIRNHECVLARRGASGAKGRGERVALWKVEIGVGSSKPLRIGRIAAVLKEAKKHQIAHERSREQSRTELIATDEGRAMEVLELCDPFPVARHHKQPHIVGIPRQ